MGAPRCTHFEFFHHTYTTEYLSAGALSVAADVVIIPLTHPLLLKTTGADAEALTLADGVPGQTVTINIVTDGGGDGTLTPATVTGFATIVLADAGDQVTLGYVNDTIGWILLAAHGLVQPPVITV